MIGYLSGRIVAFLESQMILKIPSGVGYILSKSPYRSYMVNENLDLFIWEVKREDKDELFAFENMDDRIWAEKLTKVSGVGPKMAANILYTIGYQKVIDAVQQADIEILSDIKGLGQKTAKKIILELKGATTDLENLQTSESSSQMSIDFTDTLSNLGYKRGEIVATISKLKKQGSWQEGNLVDTVKKGLEILNKR